MHMYIQWLCNERDQSNTNLSDRSTWFSVNFPILVQWKASQQYSIQHCNTPLMLTKTGQENWTAPHGICISTTHDHSLFSSLASSHSSLCLYSVAHYLTHPPTGLSNSSSGKEQWVLYYTQRPRVLINSLVLFIINPIPPPKYHTSDTRFMYW